MVVPNMPAGIIDLLDLERDMTTVSQLIQKYRRMVKLKCPHDLALDRLHEALLATLRDVTGEATPPWAEAARLRNARIGRMG